LSSLEYSHLPTINGAGPISYNYFLFTAEHPELSGFYSERFDLLIKKGPPLIIGKYFKEILGARTGIRRYKSGIRRDI